MNTMSQAQFIARLLWVSLFAWSAVAHAATYYVQPTGVDTNPGSVAAPFATIRRAAEVAVAPGDLVLVAPGTYPEAVIVMGSGTATKPITFRSQTYAKAVITGDVRPQAWPGDHAIGGANAHPYVVFEGFTFAGRASLFQLRMARGWRAISNVFRDGQNGINARADGIQIDHNQFRDLEGHAYVVYGSAGPMVRGNTVRRINTAGAYDPAASAVSKFGYTTGLRFQDNFVADSVGPGVWLDFENRGYVLERNTILRQRGRTAAWQGPGIQTEIDAGPGTIRNNRIEDNQGPGIAILESANVTVEDNTILCGPGYAGVELRNTARGPGIQGEIIRHNHIEGCGPIPGARGAAIKFAVGTNPGYGVLTAYGNTFAQGTDPLYDWFGTKAYTEAEACTTFGFECE
jgi:parallel beta-helix repeat protein